MAYTVGAGTGDDIAFSTGTTLGADNRSCFVCGWWYPTTLTATRGYWSAGNTFGAEVDTTTSELRLRTDNTTDGQWTTTGANITTNKWWFLAFLNATENTGVLSPWRVWVGDVENPPVAVTVTNATAPAGNFTGSSACVIGNKGTGTLAFRGDVGWSVFIATDSASHLSVTGVNTTGVIDADVEYRAYQSLVLPFWSSNPDFLQMKPSPTTGQWIILHNTMDFQNRHFRRGHNGTIDMNGAATVNGATLSQQREPRPLAHNWMSFPQLVRR